MEEILNLFTTVLRKCKEIHASDLHLCVGSPWKYRIHGEILPIQKLPPLKPAEAEAIVRHILHQANRVPADQLDARVRALQDLDCAYSVPGVSRFRVNICRQRGTWAVVLRVIPFTIPTFADLGLPPVIGEITLEERGLILVTGVTGSGKSTTLAAMINHLNQRKACKIVTIEDPIEYLHNEVKASVVQREVGQDTESFATALRAVLRQDPDIILVGEMRDRITIETALKAAETGHLVLSTLHTEDAPRTIHRILSVFDPGDQKAVRLRLAEALRAVVSQRLLRRKDTAGRVVVVEILRNTLAIKECIETPEKSGHLREFIQTGRDQYGMQTFDQHLTELYTKGIIDLAIARSAATSAADFERNLQFV